MKINLGGAVTSWVELVRRFRWVYFLACLGGAAVLFQVESRDYPHGLRLFLPILLYGVFALPIWLVSGRGIRPSFLTLERDGFATPHDVGQLASTAAVTFSYGILSGALRDQGSLRWWYAVLTVLVILAWWRALRWEGVRLRPDGVLLRDLRSRLIPWDEHPQLLSGSQLPRRYVEWGERAPMLLPGKHRFRPAIDVGYLADAIREYVAHPQYRADIGTPGELARLMTALRRG